jgi:hypothetical protein
MKGAHALRIPHVWKFNLIWLAEEVEGDGGEVGGVSA